MGGLRPGPRRRVRAVPRAARDGGARARLGRRVRDARERERGKDDGERAARAGVDRRAGVARRGGRRGARDAGRATRGVRGGRREAVASRVERVRGDSRRERVGFGERDGCAGGVRVGRGRERLDGGGRDRGAVSSAREDGGGGDVRRVRAARRNVGKKTAVRRRRHGAVDERGDDDSRQAFAD